MAAIGRRVCVLALSLALMFALGASTVMAQEVNIPDPALEAAVRAQLEIGEPQPITDTDMLALQWLYSDNGTIADLTGLEAATNLTDLRLSDNDIVSIAPLAGLTRLQFIDLSGNEISDISALDDQALFVDVDLSENHISDLSALAGARFSMFLRLNDNEIRDISPLRTASVAYILDLGDNMIRDISPLTPMIQGVEYLNLDNNHVSDISPLQDYSTDPAHSISFKLNYLDLDPASSTWATLQNLIWCGGAPGDYGRSVGYLPQKTHVEQASELVAFAESAAADGGLQGVGKGKVATSKLAGFIGKLKKGSDLIEQSRYSDALTVLAAASAQCDGAERPKDTVAGTACGETHMKLQALIERCASEGPQTP